MRVPQPTQDPVGLATVAAARALGDLALNPAKKIGERQLALALGEALPGSVVERKLYVPSWDPQPGNVDVFTLDDDGQAVLVVEAKLKSGNQLFECLWDMAKCLSLATADGVEGVYLVAGTTTANWVKPVTCAQLFSTGQHGLVELIEGHRDLWIKYILGDSAGRPTTVPDLVDIEVVADVPYLVQGVQWQLKAIRMSTAPESRWVPFRDGLPIAP